MRLHRWIRHAVAALVLLAGQAGLATPAPSLFTIGEPWVDEANHPVHLAQWRGRPTVMAMEYSACRFICSLYWRRLLEVQQEADRRGLAIEFVILSIDPEHDTPQGWRDYRQARGLQRANWHFLTGSRPMTTRAAALLGVRWWYDEDHLMHDFRIVRLDAAGAPAASLVDYDQRVDDLLGRP